MPVDIDFVLIFRATSNLDWIISAKFCCFRLPSPVALPRGTEKIKACARGHTVTGVSGSSDLNLDDLSSLLL